MNCDVVGEKLRALSFMPSYNLGCSRGQEPCLVLYQCISMYLYCLYAQIPHALFLECRGSSLVLLMRPWQEGLHCHHKFS